MKINRIKALKNGLLLLGMMILMPAAGWGQSSFTGIWYIDNNYQHTETTDKRWYLVPADDPQQNPTKIDAYYSPNHNTENGNSEKPFLTTYKTNKDAADVPAGVVNNLPNNSVWIVVPSETSGYYHVIHAASGKYVIYEVPLPNEPNTNTNANEGSNGKRKTMHLQTIDNDTYNLNTNDNFNFAITGSVDGDINIRPKNRSGWYWNPAGTNQNYYHGIAGGSIYHIGLVGVYENSGSNSIWHFEDATLLAPTISSVDPSTNYITVTDNNSLPAGYNIRYTTDGNNPTASSDIMVGGTYYVSTACTLKAVIERYGVVLTEVATADLVPVIPDAPTFTVNCDNTVSLSCVNIPEASIYYNLTTDGTEPESPTSASSLYDGTPFVLNVGDKIKAISINGSLQSTVSSYTHALAYAALPTVSISGTTVTITPATGTTVYYTINGTEPTTSSTPYTSPIAISETGPVDVRYMAVQGGLSNSCVAWVGRPAIVSDDCSNDNPRGNVMTVTGPDALSYWYAITAVNGSTTPDDAPDLATFTEYTLGNEMNLDDLTDGNGGYCTVHVFAQTVGGTSLAVSSTVHQLKTPGKPVLTPPVGSSPVVGISGGVYGDVAVCSATDVATQNVPIASDGSAEYTIPAAATGTLTVVFRHGDWQTSCEATYVLPSPPATPTWTQSCDNKLSLHCATPMADIHYTIDGTEPTLANDTYIEGCLDNIAENTRVRAKAFLGFRASGELDYTYSPENPDVPQFFVDGTSVVITGPSGTSVYYTKNEGTSPGVVPDDPDDPTSSSTLVNGAITISSGNIITVFKAIAISSGNASCVVRVVTREGYSINTASDLEKLNENPSSYFFVLDDIDAANTYPTNTVDEFTGVLDGNYHTISNLNKPLFDNIRGTDTHNAAVLNVMLKKVTIDNATGHAGAIANTASGYTRIYNCGILPDDSDGTTTSSISGSDYVGGLVGFLDGTARVINCFSYANITGGTHRAGIVGYNNCASTSVTLQTMVMNCMFYGDIDYQGATKIYPVYGGVNISNKYHDGGNGNGTGLNNYCYFYYNGDYVDHIGDDDYHGALGAEERFLNRFELFRMTLNSTRDMAAFYVSGTVNDKPLMAKWVLDKSIAPYPILKEPGYYPSLVNFDAEHAAPIDPDNAHYNEGRKLGTLTVNISGVGGGAQFDAPTDAHITTSSLTLNVIDKDPNNYNFNYKKVQLPYYSEVGEGNYTKASDNTGRVVTGWKIVEINGSTTGTGSFTTANYDYPNWNFVDRACSNKDFYSVSGRVFNQGAYWEVPDDVTSITIEPYWAKMVLLSDKYYDETYSGSTKYGVNVAGESPTEINGQTVNLTVAYAMTALAPDASHTVYDYAVVLVGNYHQYDNNAIVKDNTPVTFMSADLDGDCEPDYTLFYYHNARKAVAPIRFDFLNMPGIGMVKRTWDSDTKPEPGIFKPIGWFEITNTVFMRFGQFEYADDGKSSLAPCILQGGIYEQFVSAQQGNSKNTNYLLVGGNAWFKNFANGCHTANFRQTPKVPINVTGGDYENFYLTGIYQPDGDPTDENAECYIDGGRFGEVAGAGMQRVDGSVTWLINAADMDYFFGGGINGAQSITGDVTTTISNSRVTQFYGGPKFGAMASDKKVTTTATDCTFDLFFGAGYGGTSLNRIGCEDVSATTDTPPWSTYLGHYTRSYETTHHSNNGSGSNITVNAVSTSYDYEYILHSDGNQTVARFFVNFASLSLASTKDVETTLTGCTMRKFYGGGRLGAVQGNVNSTLTDCTITGDVFGSGYSADAPSVSVMPIEIMDPEPKYNRRAGVFNNSKVQMPATVEYTWSDDASLFNLGTSYFKDDGDTHLIYTNQTLSGLGAVEGDATLTLQGNTTVGGNVYGGGAKSSSNTNGGEAKTTVNILGGTYGTEGNTSYGNIYGGGEGDANNAVTEGNVEVNIGNSGQTANNVVIHGSVFGCNNVNGTPLGNATVNVYRTKILEGNSIQSVFGGGNVANYAPTTDDKEINVHIFNCTNKIGEVYGGGRVANAGTNEHSVAVNVTVDGGTIENVFSGAKGEVGNAADIVGDVTLNLQGGTITGNAFGGSNTLGDISGTITVNVDDDANGDCALDVANVYGGGNVAHCVGTSDVNVISGTVSNNVFGGGKNANVGGGDVEMTGGTVLGSVYGGGEDGNVNGDTQVNITGGTLGSAERLDASTLSNVFGGGLGSGTQVSGNVEVNVNGGTLYGDVYGGSALGSVNTDNSNTTTVNISSGTLETKITTTPTAQAGITANVYNGGNVFGGGLGNGTYAAAVNGVVTVNIGSGTVTDDLTLVTSGLDGSATIKGNVYGCNNTNGSPQQNVTVNVFQTAAAIPNVFGGGNKANFLVDGKTANVNIYTCDNQIGRVFGGGNAAATNSVRTMIQGGTITEVYGGGNGEVDPANVNGDVTLDIHGGIIGQTFAGSNQQGSISGSTTVTVDDVVCSTSMEIDEFFCGGNYANVSSDIVAEIACNDGYIHNLYGGCNQANVVSGSNVTLTVEGGEYDYIYGGSKGTLTTPADIAGNVTLNIYGGTIHNAIFGGCNINGSIGGTIIVNVEDKGNTGCNLDASTADVYGGGNLAAYTAPNATPNYPEVNIIHGTVKNVYGGGLGATAVVTGNPKVTVGGTVASHRAVVRENIYGGGNAAQVTGNTEVQLTQRAKVFGNVYGGGNEAEVTGNTKVIVNGATPQQP